VAHALHQLAQPGTCTRRQHVPGVAQIVKVDQRQLSSPERREPDPLPIVYAARAPDVLSDDRHDRCRDDNHALASVGLRWREAEPAATQLDQLPRDTKAAPLRSAAGGASRAALWLEAPRGAGARLALSD
jgi:hypothetical protein